MLLVKAKREEFLQFHKGSLGLDSDGAESVDLLRLHGLCFFPVGEGEWQAENGGPEVAKID